MEQAKAQKQNPTTMQDVARDVGVSLMTVSYALNGTGRVSQGTRQIVLEAARRMDFEPNPHAQRLSRGRSHNTIGLFSLGFGFGVGIRNIQLIQSILNSRGFDVPVYGMGLHDSHDEEAQAAAIAAVRRQRPDALACVSGGLHPKAVQELQRYQDEGGTLVCYDVPIAIECDQVIFDREDNTYRATRHLLELGHRHIGFGVHALAAFSVGRITGYKRALVEFGVKPREDWLLEGKSNTDYTLGGVNLAHAYLELKDRPQAIAILNDYAAMSFMGELYRAGLICPHDISIVGHDDHALSRHHMVPLTTASHPSEVVASHVGQLLLSRLDGEYEGPPRRITVHGELIVRQSTQAPLTPI